MVQKVSWENERFQTQLKRERMAGDLQVESTLLSTQKKPPAKRPAAFFLLTKEGEFQDVAGNPEYNIVDGLVNSREVHPAVHLYDLFVVL